MHGIADEGHAELLQSSADLQGCCLLPWALSSPSAIGRVTAPVDGSSQSGQLLVLRLDALGSIHLHINRHGDDTEGRQSITNVQPAFCISPPMQLLVQLGSSAAGEEVWILPCNMHASSGHLWGNVMAASYWHRLEYFFEPSMV